MSRKSDEVDVEAKGKWDEDLRIEYGARSSILVYTDEKSI
jgi:hypothetical protein